MQTAPLTRRAPLFSLAHPFTQLVCRGLLALAALTSILVTASIVLSILLEAIRFFHYVSPVEFLFGTHWSPQSESYGAVPLFTGTLLIMLIAMGVAVPIGLLSAIYLAEYSTPRFRGIVKPALEMLAGIPTVVYGVVAILIVAPGLRMLGNKLGLSVASESALGAGIVMGVMIIPFISSLSDDILSAVPNALREAAMGLGATKSETICQVVLPAALPGIMGALLLGVSRAIGETMIVVMAAGMTANLSFNPLQAVTTVTVQMVALLVGDQEFDSPKTLAAFGLGLTLFIATLLLNIAALWIVKRYRQAYD